MVKEALALARLGFAVFPLATNTKLPKKGSAGVKDATTDSEKIKRLFATSGKPFNLAIAVGQISGIVAIDLDRNHGATDEDLARLPRSVTVKTRNGYHRYYKITRPVKNGALWGGKSEGDNTAPAYLRSDGYYFVGPGSVVTWDESTKQHLAPHEYTYHADAGGSLSFDECELAPLPEEFYRDGYTGDNTGAQATIATNEYATLQPLPLAGTPRVTGQDAGDGRPAAQSDELLTYQPGLRHDCFVRTAVSMRKRGRSIEDIRRVLLERNQTDFTIPKENAKKEIDALLEKWIVNKVQPLVIFEIEKAKTQTETGEIEYLLPLGHLDGDYYYTTNSNRQIVKMPASGHTPLLLLNLQPLDFWKRLYPKPARKDGDEPGVNWQQAATEMMEACRIQGIYSDQKVRGVGCWEDKGKLIYHTGSELMVSGQVLDLNGLTDSNYLYTLRPSIAADDSNPHRPLTISECQVLTNACQAIAWQAPQSAKLFAGALAIARLCGALPWRPHVWLTSERGFGKSVIMAYLVRPLLGSNSSLYILGETTSAGIRQRLESDSKPIIFDESETNNDRSSKRMQHVVELARQASFENDGEILKGTADGSGHSYKITSMFFLSSIRVNLIDPADISRFAVLHLAKPDPAKWPEVEKTLANVTHEYGDRLFSRMLAIWPVLLRNIKKMEDAIAVRYDRRTGQQYGALFAGHYSLSSDDVMTDDEARQIATDFNLETASLNDGSTDGDESDALDWTLSSQVKYSFKDITVTETFASLINKARVDKELRQQVLHMHGLDVDAQRLYIYPKSPFLVGLYRNTKWGSLFSQALQRLPGTEKSVVRRLAGKPSRMLAVTLPQSPEDTL